jgi:hypothetical protein
MSFVIIKHIRIYVLEVFGLTTWCLGTRRVCPNGGGAEHNDEAEWRAVDSRTCAISIFMCSVRYLLCCMLVMFDVWYLLCCILVMFDVWYLLCGILVIFDVCDNPFDDMWCWIVIYVESHCICVCCYFLYAYFRGSLGRQNRQKKILCSSVIFLRNWLMFLSGSPRNISLVPRGRGT